MSPLRYRRVVRRTGRHRKQHVQLRLVHRDRRDRFQRCSGITLAEHGPSQPSLAGGSRRHYERLDRLPDQPVDLLVETRDSKPLWVGQAHHLRGGPRCRGGKSRTPSAVLTILSLGWCAPARTLLGTIRRPTGSSARLPTGPGFGPTAPTRSRRMWRGRAGNRSYRRQFGCRW